MIISNPYQYRHNIQPRNTLRHCIFGIDYVSLNFSSILITSLLPDKIFNIVELDERNGPALEKVKFEQVVVWVCKRRRDVISIR